MALLLSPVCACIVFVCCVVVVVSTGSRVEGLALVVPLWSLHIRPAVTTHQIASPFSCISMAFWSKEKTLGFIEKYRAHECLWKVKSKDYNNKFKKDRAYEELINFIKPFQSDANKDTVSAKINNLRCCWRKENKKRKMSMLSGASPDEVYEPTLFYFDYLNFIYDPTNAHPLPRPEKIETGFDIRDNAQPEDKDVDYHQYYQEEAFYPQDGDISIYDDNDDQSDSDDNMSSHSLIVTPCAPGNGTASPSSSRTTPAILWRARTGTNQERVAPHTKRRKKSHHETDRPLMPTPAACEKWNAPNPPNTDITTEDEFDCFGQTVAHALRNMPREQTIHAKKLIADVLYEGELCNLSRASTSCFLPVPEHR